MWLSCSQNPGDNKGTVCETHVPYVTDGQPLMACLKIFQFMGF